jgi:hypothetical protein
MYAKARKEVQKHWIWIQMAKLMRALGRIKQLYDWDWIGADASFKLALELEPANADVLLFEWLERAYRQRDGGLVQIKGDRLLRNLERDPRYNVFLKKMNLPLN